MPKKLVQDIIPKKKSIRSVIKESPTERVVINKIEKRKEIKENNTQEEKIKIDEILNTPKEKVSKNSQIFLWIITIGVVTVLLFLLTAYFATADITITPRNESIKMDDSYSISSSSSSSTISFEVMTIQASSSKTLASDSEEDVQRKATGKVMLYNNYSQSKQRLINNTRLEAANGKIYRLRESVDVPGYKVINGTKTPGSIEVNIIADSAGEDYNMKITDFKGDFKIPGFKGSPKYTSFYGRLTSDIGGGFIGRVKKVSDDKLSASRKEINDSLKESLIKEMYQEKPNQYVIFNNNYYIEYSDLPDSSNSSDYSIGESATLHAIMFNESGLAGQIAKNKLKDYDNSVVDMIWGDDLSVTISGTTDRPWEEGSLKVKFSGNMQIVWNYDPKTLLDSIKGQNKKTLKDIVTAKFGSSISGVSGIIRPQWKQSLPDNVNKIKLFDSIKNTEIR
jgi:hypothetical protein